MEIRVLRYFLAVAREQNITVAANYLHITQPTLSRQIKELENELGFPLLIRKSHNVILTEEGMLFRNRAEEIVSMVDKTEDEFKAMKNDISGDIFIGTAESHIMKHIAKILKDLQNEFPNIHYHLVSGNEQDVTDLLDKGLLDFCILVQPADISKYDYLNLPDKDVWGIVMKKDDVLAQKQVMTRSDLVNLPLICSRQSIQKMEYKKNNFIEWFEDDFDKLNIVSTFNLPYNASILVDANIGYAITIDKVTDISNDSSVCFRPLSPKLESKLNIVWKKYSVFSKPAEKLLQKLKLTFKED